MTYKITKVIADWQASNEEKLNPIDHDPIEEDKVVKLEAEEMTDRLADSIIANLNK